MDNSIKYIISGGVKEGWSTDMDAALFADALNVKRFYKLSNIDHIYTKDPALEKDAKIITEISWPEYFKVFGIVQNSQHIPNANMPIDPICANFCANKELSVFVSGGKSLDETKVLETVFESGTYLHP
jgi:uridylate kinase